MKQWMMIFAATALAVVTAFPAMAYREMRAGYGRGPGNIADIAEEHSLSLVLTAAQKAKIDILRKAHLKDIKPLQDKMLEKSRQLRSLWLEAMPNRQKINALQKEAQALREDFADKLANYRQKVMKLLTPEQQAKIRASGMGQVIMGPGSGNGYGWQMR